MERKVGATYCANCTADTSRRTRNLTARHQMHNLRRSQHKPDRRTILPHVCTRAPCAIVIICFRRRCSSNFGSCLQRVCSSCFGSCFRRRKQKPKCDEQARCKHEPKFDEHPLRKYIHIQIHTCIYMYLHIYIYNTHIYVHIYIYTHIRITHIYIYIYICMYIYIHKARADKRAQSEPRAY